MKRPRISFLLTFETMSWPDELFTTCKRFGVDYYNVSDKDRAFVEAVARKSCSSSSKRGTMRQHRFFWSDYPNAYAAGALPLKPKKPPVRGPFKPHPGGNFSVFARLPAAHQNGQYGLLGVQTVLGLFKDLIGVAFEGLHRDLLALACAWRVRPSSVASHCFFSFMPIFSAAA